MRVPVVAVLLVLALASSAPVFAGHATQSFSAEGDLFLGGVVINDEDVITIPSWAPGHVATLTGGSAGAYDLDIYWRQGSQELDDASCATASADETCVVPPTATGATISLFYGAQVHWTLDIVSTAGSSAPVACADGVDNDGDLLVDYPDDGGCASALDDTEYAGTGPFIIGSGIPDFDDGRYHEIGLFAWDTTALDVLVVPPVALVDIPLTRVAATARLAAVEKSIDAWESGIQQLGAPWLAQGLVIDAYTVGFDTIPPAALADPEIVVLTAEYNPALLLGIGFSPSDLVCGASSLSDSAHVRTVAGPAPDASHRHPGSPWGVTMCRSAVDNVCFVINTNPVFGDFFWDASSQHMMYDLNAHEFGHCLGIGHVGDAGDFSSQAFPTEDIMSYQTTPTQVHCVSNLNLRAMEGMFAKAFGRPQSEWLERYDDVSMAPSDYARVTCANP